MIIMTNPQARKANSTNVLPATSLLYRFVFVALSLLCVVHSLWHAERLVPDSVPPSWSGQETNLNTSRSTSVKSSDQAVETELPVANTPSPSSATNPKPYINKRQPEQDQCQMPEDRKAMDDNWIQVVKALGKMPMGGLPGVGGFDKSWYPTMDCPKALTTLAWVNASQGIVGCPRNASMWTFYEKGETRALANGTARAVQCGLDGQYTLAPGWGVAYENSIRLRPNYNPEAVERAKSIMEKRRKQQQEHGKNFSRPPNILVYVLDAVSRPSFFRSLRATKQTIEDIAVRSRELQTNVFEFGKHHSVGGSSTRNLIPMMTGILQLDIRKGNGTHAWCFEEARRNGYISLLTHNDCVLTNATFGPKRSGFTPEYYFPIDMEDIGWFGPLFCAQEEGEPELVVPPGKCGWTLDTNCSVSAEESMNRISCLGGRSRTTLLLEHYLQARSDHSEVPMFGFIHDYDIHIWDLPSANRYDPDKARIMPMLEPILKETVVILVSDHGNQYEISSTRLGLLEYKMPFLYIFVPEQLLQENPTWREALASNQQVLTSPRDVHETVVELIGGRDVGDVDWWKKHGQSAYIGGNSLLHGLPYHRTCADAKIPDAECICGRDPRIELTPQDREWHRVRKKYMPLVMDHINRHLYVSGLAPHLCREVKFREFRSMHYEQLRNRFRYYDVQFSVMSPRTEPMILQASFQAGHGARNADMFHISTIIQTSRFAKWIKHCERDAKKTGGNLHWCDCVAEPPNGWEGVAGVEK